MTSKPKPLTSRGASTRRRIIEATADLVYAKGADSTTLDDVRAEAGVSKSQLYHYFADKDALIREVIIAQTAQVLAAQEPALGQIDSLAALRRWRDCILELMRMTCFGGCPLGTLANELANKSEPARALLIVGFGAWADRLTEGFERMRASGELARSAAPKDLALAVLSAVQGGLLLAKTERGEEPLKIALNMAIDHVGKHCVSRPGTAAPAKAVSVRKRRRKLE
jgi:TetR/AcrR family transcriptional regulator, transcriptional repressor for nem operon